MSKKSKLKSLGQFVDEPYGKKGTPNRYAFEGRYETFKISFILQKTRLMKCLTQEQLVDRCGTNKDNISKMENDLEEVPISTLLKLVEEGLDGELEFKI